MTTNDYQPYSSDHQVLGFCNHRRSNYPVNFKHLATFSNWNTEHDQLDEASQPKNYQFQLDGVKFANVEQFMMREKALTFNDQVTADQIMTTSDPKECKALGRQVTGYDEQVWNKVRKEKVKRGIKAKFAQNSGLLDGLLQTEGKTLVEAAWYDNIWGIGMRATDPRVQDPEQWQGRNLLGECLMEIREELS